MVSLKFDPLLIVLSRVCMLLYNSQYIMKNVDLDSLLWSSKYIELFADASNDLGLWVEEIMKTLNCDEDSDITLAKHIFIVFQGIVHFKCTFLSANRKIEEMKYEMIKA